MPAYWGVLAFLIGTFIFFWAIVASIIRDAARLKRRRW